MQLHLGGAFLPEAFKHSMYGVYLYISIYTCVYIYIHVSIYIYVMYIYVYTYTLTCRAPSAHTCMHTCIHRAIVKTRVLGVVSAKDGWDGLASSC